MMPNRAMASIGAALTLANAPAAAKPAGPVTLHIEGGMIAVPAAAADGMIRFRGIPYAAPPVGGRRWRPPAPVVPWRGRRAADGFGADCMQPDGAASPASRPKSEDCLFLNVSTLGIAPARPRPVFVWIHGGGSQFGSGAQPQFDGTALAKKGIVVVTINYRLGAFGFLSTPQLSDESGYDGSGNYGFMDDIAALQWVRRNIARFGGDPRQVTIGGESSGSVSTGALMTSPLARGLFHRVIGESGSVFRLRGNGSMGANSLEPEEKKGTLLMRDTGANSLADLRAAPAKAILAAAARQMPAGDFFNQPTVDNYVLPAAPWDVFAARRQNDVPLLVGWNSGEGSMELMIFKSLGTLPRQLARYYGDLWREAAPFYPIARPDDIAVQLRAAGDNGFGYPTWKWAYAQSRFGKAPVYVYEFDRAPRVAEGFFGKDFDTGLAGAFHGAEISYVFDTLDSQQGWTVAPDDRRIAATMSSLWANFIKASDPNGPGLPRWPAYDTAREPQRMRIGLTSEAVRDPDHAKFLCLKSIHDRIDLPEPSSARSSADKMR
jgi:para-nitrobenzyl esterase